MMQNKKPRKRDDREYDTTQLRFVQQGANLHRDYTAHFFRWSFARRMIKQTDTVLDIGCGQDKPLYRILLTASFPIVKRYIGVDLNPLKPTTNQNADFRGEFNFVERWKELNVTGKCDVVVHLEVFEHMHPRNGVKMLKACWQCLRPGGIMIMSTPCYDGKRHAANHIHEYTVPELQKVIERCGFKVEKRYGTFMDVKYIKQLGSPAMLEVCKQMSEYFDGNAISNFFAPMFPDHSRNNLWVCRKPR